MELLDALLPFLLLLIYFLSQSRKRGATKKPAPQVEATSEGPRELTPFEQIIQRIQEAAEQAQNPTPEPAPSSVSSLKREGRETAHESTAAQAWNDRPAGVNELGQFEHDKHGFGAENPFSEEIFEQEPPQPSPPAHASGHLDYDPHKSIASLLDGDRLARVQHPMVNRLRRQEGLKEAFVLKEILDKPRSQRWRNR